MKVYHAMLRSVNKQQIFECTEDYEQFVRILQRMCGMPVETRPSRIRDKAATAFERPERHCYIYAWCLMGNHVHLLLKEADEPIGDVMKRISSSYVYYYNHKYDRVGHLFQERFKSQPVTDMEYFLTVFRYIHQNPLKPHLVADLRDYRWSSWREYMGLCERPFSSIGPVLGRKTIDELHELVCKPMGDDEERGLLDVEMTTAGLTDEQAWSIIERHSGATNASQFQAMDRPRQKHCLYLAHEDGVGPRMLSRLTGVTYSIVQKATSAANERRESSAYAEDEEQSSPVAHDPMDDGYGLEKYPEY